ncbi:MAG TPA: glycosyltransferase family 4 protein [Verrucomicrobiae bacterium]|jgi:glycosyltransferase involved in cell wall biosynthesis|nr:glycosyltransferase family 4 protein [Verrucomicrobiae bacterium]
MRLLFVHDRFGAMAGAEVNLQLTAAALKTRGHQAGLLHGPPTGKGEEVWSDLFPERFALAAENNSRAARAALETFQPDAIYVHKMAEAAVLATLADSGVPVVRMVHDHDLYCMRSYKYFPLTRTICTRGAGLHCIFPCGATIARNRGGAFPLKWMSYRARKKEIALNRRFERMIVATDYMKRELLRNGFDARRIEIHAPVPRGEERAAGASFSGRNLIIYAGQVIRGKGVDVLLESLAQVRVPFECLIFGDGHHRAYCEELARRLGLEDRVQFKGYVAPAELENFYAQASLAVVSSVWPEPFGAVGLEAMRHGLPVVAFEAGGIGEWLLDGENGFLVPWMNRKEFAARIEQLLADKTQARQFGERGRRLLRDKFNFEQYISGLEEMFSRVINQRREPAAAGMEHGQTRA